MVCTGGDTKLTPGHLHDCAGTCNTSYVDTCGVCQVHGFTTDKDCNGDCAGDARTNECGVCVEGNTGRKKNYGEFVNLWWNL